MSEVTSLHEDDWRSRPSRCPTLSPIRDEEWDHHSPRSPRRWEQDRAGSGRPRARSVDALDDLNGPGSAESGRRSPASSGRRGRAPPRSCSRDDLYNLDDSRDFTHSRDPHYDDVRCRDRPPADPRSRYRSRDPRDDGSQARDPQYDGRLLEEALRRKGPGERRRPYRDEGEEEAYYPPAPPPYSETESQASRERKLKKVSKLPYPTQPLQSLSASTQFTSFFLSLAELGSQSRKFSRLISHFVCSFYTLFLVLGIKPTVFVLSYVPNLVFFFLTFFEF